MTHKQRISSCVRLSEEPRLRELLDDPILHLILHRDGISMDELEVFLDQMRFRLIAQRWRFAA